MRLSVHSMNAFGGLVLCALLWGAPTAVHAEIFKCVSQEGKISYSDSACAKGAAQSANITAAVGACITAECEAQRAQQASAAQQRLREEKETLSEMVQQRRQADAKYAAERARLVEAQRLAALEEKVDSLLYQGDQVYPLYAAFPLYPGQRPCRGTNCIGRPRPPGGMPGHVQPHPLRPVRADRLDPPLPLWTPSAPRARP